MSKKDGKSFKEYALAVQVKSSLTDRETVSIFLSTLKKPYFDHMIGQVTADFATLIMIGERIEDSLKNGQLTDIEALRSIVEKQSGNNHKKIQGNGRKHEGKKESDVNFVTSQVPRILRLFNIIIRIPYLLIMPTNYCHLSMLIGEGHLFLPRMYITSKSQSFPEFETTKA